MVRRTEVSAIKALRTADRDELPTLERSYRDGRSLLSMLLSLGTGLATVIACIPLFSVLIMLFWRGGSQLGWRLLTELPPTPFEDGGGFGNAIVGTLTMIGIAALLSVPFGILAAIFLAETGPDSKIAIGARFCAKTLSLAVLIYNFSGMPFENQIEMAWAASLVLVLLVLVINIIGQLFSRRRF
jgi:phosphate transport system permease protein